MSLFTGWVMPTKSVDAECDTCGRDISDLRPIKAAFAPGRYCSDECATDADARFAW